MGASTEVCFHTVQLEMFFLMVSDGPKAGSKGWVRRAAEAMDFAITCMWGCPWWGRRCVPRSGTEHQGCAPIPKGISSCIFSSGEECCVSVSGCHSAKTITGYAQTLTRDGFVFFLLYCCPSLTLLPTDSVISC